MEERLKRAAPAPRAERMVLAAGELLVALAGGVATVTLNRPAVLNALSFGMLTALGECLDAWERDGAIDSIVLRGAGDRAFCAGGDIRHFYEAFRSGQRDQRHFYEVEYALDRRIHEYPKRVVAIMDGITMGGGMGLAQGASLRIVGDRSRLAMPETAIGWFPDVGASYFLSRLPGKLGLYLGLTGTALGAADALYCGLADLHLERAAIDDFSVEAAQRLGKARLDGAALERLRPAIDEHFGEPSATAIVASLEREERPAFRDWAVDTRRTLARRSPTMLAVTCEQLQRGAHMSLGECFRMELDLVEACFGQGDFLEGIRALLIDKDHRPRWSPAALSEVSRDTIDRFFTQGKA